jgi:MFS family permease
VLTIPASLKVRKFAIFWTGLLISIAGSQMQFWALLWHVATLTNDPIVVSGIGAARFIPILLFSLVAGVVADSINRRAIMFITQSTMMAVALVLGLLTRGGHIQIWHIYLLTAIQATAASFDLPARQALTPNLIPRDLYPNAFSMQSIAFNTGSIIGPGLSGIVISAAGLHWVYFINAISYLAVIIALMMMGPVEQTRGVPATSPRVVSLTAIREGIHFIAHSPIILSSMLLDFFATFFSSANTLLPFVAKQILHVGAVDYGWLSAGQSIGAVSVALIFSQRNIIRRQGRILLGAVTAFGIATIVFGLSGYFWLTLFSLVFIGASDSVSTILRNTIRQLQTPDYIRGRMVSINQIFFSGGPQLGEIEAGAVAQGFGLPAAIVTGGVGCIVTVLAVIGIWPQLWRYNGDETTAS